MWPPLVERTRDHPEYPASLLELARPPSPLFLRGDLPPLDRAVAIVGSREASVQGCRIAHDLALAAGRAGLVIVSGGALGIDTAAHEGALAAGAPTIAVLPAPLDRPTPRRNWRLFDRILEAGGAWVSELAVPPEHKGEFSNRNRIIAALARVVVVVEARESSGTRHTVQAARVLGRPVGAVPWSVGCPQGEGCVRVFRLGGRVVASAADLLEMVGAPGPAPVERPGPELDARKRAIVEAVARTEGEVERIALEAGLGVREVLAELTELELDGVIEPLPGGRFKIAVELGRERKRYVLWR